MKKKTMIIIAVALVLVIAIVAGALFMMMNKGDEEKLYFHVPGEYFVTNIKDSNNLLKVTVTLALTTDKEEETLTANNAIIRNDIVFIMRAKTKEELRSPDIEEVLSAEICQKLSEDLKLDIFKRVYFSDLVIQ